jgi:outer membrane protein OmpU
MKKVLFATTALVLTAGVAAAEVSTGGSGRMGVVSIDGSDLSFTSRIRITFSASGETDGGLAFGGSIRADNASEGDDDNDFAGGGGDTGADGSVFIEGAFGKLSMGDVSGAPEAAVGDVSGVGLTGIGDFNEFTYLSNSDRPAMRWDYVTGDLGFHVSADNPGPAGDQAYGVAVTYGMGDISFGLGYEDDGVDDHTIVGVSAGFGDATVKAVYGDSSAGDGDQMGISLDYVFGAATVTAFYTENFAGQDAYGLGVAYDLGGASLVGGIADRDDLTDMNYDFGISFSF